MPRPLFSRSITPASYAPSITQDAKSSASSMSCFSTAMPCSRKKVIVVPSRPATRTFIHTSRLVNSFWAELTISSPFCLEKGLPGGSPMAALFFLDLLEQALETAYEIFYYYGIALTVAELVRPCLVERVQVPGTVDPFGSTAYTGKEHLKGFVVIGRNTHPPADAVAGFTRLDPDKRPGLDKTKTSLDRLFGKLELQGGAVGAPGDLDSGGGSELLLLFALGVHELFHLTRQPVEIKIVFHMRGGLFCLVGDVDDLGVMAFSPAFVVQPLILCGLQIGRGAGGGR